jgi:hypothetical protein
MFGPGFGAQTNNDTGGSFHFGNDLGHSFSFGNSSSAPASPFPPVGGAARSFGQTNNPPAAARSFGLNNSQSGSFGRIGQAAPGSFGASTTPNSSFSRPNTNLFSTGAMPNIFGSRSGSANPSFSSMPSTQSQSFGDSFGNKPTGIYANKGGAQVEDEDMPDTDVEDWPDEPQGRAGEEDGQTGGSQRMLAGGRAWIWSSKLGSRSLE